MSKKHFIKLAAALKSVRPPTNDNAHGLIWSDCVQAVAFVCQDENPAFKSQKFFEACGGLFE